MLRLCIVTLGLTGSLLAGPIYKISNLGTLGGLRSEARAVNKLGAAVGVAKTSNDIDKPTSFSSSGASQFKTEGAAYADEISDNGVAVGTRYSNGRAEAVTWDGDSETVLSSPDGTESFGLGINNLGEIVGSVVVDGAAHAFLNTSEKLYDLGTLGGDWSAAYSINDSQQVAGTSTTSGGSFSAFLWNQGKLQSLGTLGGKDSHGSAINAAGSVVGHSTTKSGLTQAFLYKDGAMNALGAPLYGNSYAYGINRWDTIVGYGDAASGQRALMWRDGLMYDLQLLVTNLEGWTLDAAYDINDAGQIVGSGTYNGKQTAFRLDMVSSNNRSDDFASVQAVPEPDAATLLLGGMFLILLVKWYPRLMQARKSVTTAQSQ